jgi:hypothetical protein
MLMPPSGEAIIATPNAAISICQKYLLVGSCNTPQSFPEAPHGGISTAVLAVANSCS